MFCFLYHCQDLRRCFVSSITAKTYVDVLFPLSLPRLLPDFIRSKNWLPFAGTWVHPRFFGGVCVAHLCRFFCVVLLCVFTFWVPCCNVRYDFMLIGGRMSYLRYLWLLAASGVQHILCCVFVLLFFVLCTLSCQLIWLVYYWLSLRYSLTFILFDIL
jgi:hypothetical protein